MVPLFCPHQVCLRRLVQIPLLRDPFGFLDRPLPVFCRLHLRRQQQDLAIAHATSNRGFFQSGEPIFRLHDALADPGSLSFELLGWPRFDRRRFDQRRASAFSEPPVQPRRLCSWKARGVRLATLRCHMDSLLALIQLAVWPGDGRLDLVAPLDGHSYRVVLRYLDPDAFPPFSVAVRECKASHSRPPPHTHHTFLPPRLPPTIHPL